MSKSHLNAVWRATPVIGPVLVAAAGLGAFSPAYAQEAASAAEADIPEGEIVVTAQRREQRLQDVPLSITALSGEALADRGINDITTLSTSVPGLSFGRSGSDARPAIRGVRTEEIDAANDPVIGFFVDGIYKPRTSQALAAFVDVDRVEVLRGPQGTLFGRNTYGGSISVVSKNPQSDFGAEGEVRYASFNDIRLEGVVNIPLGTDTGLRVVGMWQESDGYVKVLEPRTATGGQASDFNDNDQHYLRGIFRTSLENVEVILRASYWDQGGFGAGGFGYTVVGSLRQNPGTGPGGATGTQDLGGFLDRNNPRGGAAPGPSDLSPYRVFRDTEVTRETTEFAANAEVNLELGSIQMKSLTGYADFSTFRQNDEDYSEAFGTFLVLDTASESFSQEFQILPVGTGRFQWVIGAYYFYENAVEDFIFGTPTAPTSFTFRQDATTNSYAGFGQAEYSLNDTITLLAGGRYTIDEKDFIYQSPITSPDLAPDRGKFEKFTWRLGANIDLTPDNLLYASVSTGFRSGGFNNGANPVVPSYGPQSVTAYEIGLKNLFREQNLTVNLAAYYNDYADILTGISVPVGITTVVQRSNAGSARAYGFEAEVAWRPVDGLQLDSSFAYSNAKFKNFIAGNPYPLATGYTLVPGLTNQLDLTGYRVPLTPEFTFNVGGRYEIELGSAGSITPEARLFWSSDYFTAESNYDAGIPGRPVGRMPSYTKTDLSLTWESADDRFLVQAFVQNLENKAVLNRTTIGGGGAIFQNFAAPRIGGVRARFKI